VDSPTFTGETLSGLTASKPVGTDANKALASLTTTGTGAVALATSPAFTTPNIGAATATSVAIASGAGAGKVYTSDGAGLGSWQNAPSGTVPDSGTTADVMLLGDGAHGYTLSGAATGTGAPVRETSPTLVTPALGTPASGTLTSCTGLPAAGVEGTAALVANTIKGDGTAGRVLRQIKTTIANGTTGVSLKCKTETLWSGDVNAEQDNITKNATTGVWSLSADGLTLTLLNTGISGDAVAVLAFNLFSNASGMALNPAVYKSATGIAMEMTHTTTGAYQDLTTLVDTGIMVLFVTYVTSA